MNIGPTPDPPCQVEGGVDVPADGANLTAGSSLWVQKGVRTLIVDVGTSRDEAIFCICRASRNAQALVALLAVSAERAWRCAAESSKGQWSTGHTRGVVVRGLPWWWYKCKLAVSSCTDDACGTWLYERWLAVSSRTPQQHAGGSAAHREFIATRGSCTNKAYVRRLQRALSCLRITALEAGLVRFAFALAFPLALVGAMWWTRRTPFHPLAADSDKGY